MGCIGRAGRRHDSGLSERMKLRADKSVGVKLGLAAALLVAVVFAFAPGVGAHQCETGLTPLDMHQDSQGVACDANSHDPSHHVLSSTVAGEVVELRLSVSAPNPVNVGAQITVDFSGLSEDSAFGLPSRIANPTTPTNANFDAKISVGSNDYFPAATSGIRKSGNQVILTVPADTPPIIGEYEITFSKAANIRNPDYAGDSVIIVSSGAQGNDVTRVEVTIRKGTTISPSEGPRGTEFDLKVNGYPRGTVTIFDGDDETIDDGEVIDAKTTINGAYTFRDLKVRGRPGNPEYTIRTRDSEGEFESVDFSINEATTTFEPSTVVVGEELKITIADWQEGDEGVSAVRIGGEDVYFAKVREYSNCYEYIAPKEANKDNVVSFKVIVPESIRPGQLTVFVYDTGAANKPRCTTTAPGTGTPSESTEEVTLSGDAPTIRKTVEIVTEVPQVAPRGPNILTRDGGRYRDLEFKATVPEGTQFYDRANDSVVIRFDPSFDLRNPDPQIDLITVEANGDAVNITNAEVNGKELELSGNFSEILSPGEYITIKIKADARIETPETPRGFDNYEDEGPYEILITFVDGDDPSPAGQKEAEDKNFVVVKNPLSSTVPGATVRVELHTHAEASVRTTDDIVVDFSGPSPDSGFVIPSSMATSRIQVRYTDEVDGKSKTFNPSEVQVQGERVIFAVPSGKDDVPISVKGDYSITFSNLARIKNPFSAGIKTIKVSSFVEGDEEDIIEAIVRRTTTITPLEGARGSEFTLEGKGYAAGTVTVYEGDDDIIDPGETLASVETVRGAFKVALTARGNPGEAQYRVTTKDSEGVDVSRAFIIKSLMSFVPPTVSPGSRLTIIISDWEGGRDEVVAAQIAGEEAFIADADEYENCIDHPNSARRDSRGRITLIVDLPPGIPTGEQTVAVFDHSQLDYFDNEGNLIPESRAKACHELAERKSWGQYNGPLTQKFRTDDPIAITKATVEIESSSLTLTPSSAARGQRVTITGSGFTRASRGDDHIRSVWIGGKKVVDDHSELEVGTDGSIAFSVAVPLEVAEGPNEVRIEGTDNTLGLATLEVPEATVSLDPAQGQRGTKFTITGSGFIANELVLVTYHSGTVITSNTDQLGISGLLADSQGGFELEFGVPITAEVGLSHLVTAVAEVETRDGKASVDAEAEHLVTHAGITTTPDSVSPGDRLTIIGEHLPPFSLVGPIKIAGIPVTPSSDVATDEDGAFETTILVPQIEFRDHTLLIQVARVIIPHIIAVAPPPLSGPPAQVFKELIKAGALSAVWQYDNATQSWSLFDPSLPDEVSELNDLTEVSSGDIVWINLSDPQYFQERDLAAGWNLIALK